MLHLPFQGTKLPENLSSYSRALTTIDTTHLKINCSILLCSQAAAIRGVILKVQAGLKRKPSYVLWGVFLVTDAKNRSQGPEKAKGKKEKGSCEREKVFP